MQRFADDRMIKRNGLIGRALTFGGLGVMVLGLVLSVVRPQLVNVILTLALVGVFTSQLGIAFYNRWGRRPRMDEILDEVLKGLDGRYAIFHYALGSSHVLISPAGVLALVPRWEKGEISYRDGNWQVLPESRNPRRAARIRRLRGVESAAQAEAEAVDQALSRRAPEASGVKAAPMLVFLNPKATLRAKDAPLFAAHAKKLKDQLRQLPRQPTLGEATVQALASRLGL